MTNMPVKILNIFAKNKTIINLYAYCPHTVQLKYFKIENFGHVTNDAFIYLIQHNHSLAFAVAIAK